MTPSLVHNTLSEVRKALTLVLQKFDISCSYIISYAYGWKSAQVWP